jgi:S-formylglutathione hydrolase FrmB
MLAGWTAIEIDGHRVELFGPARPRFAMLFLHPFGGEMPSANDAYTAAFREANLAVAAPIGGTSWWADRRCPDFSPTVTAERFLLDTVEPWMRQTWQLPERSIAIAGISMGGQGAIRLAFKHPARFPVAASVAGAFDYHEWHGRGTTIDAMYRSREACRQDTAVLQVNPVKSPPHLWLACDPDDEWYRGNDRLHEKLAAIGIAHTTHFETRLGGHGWPYFDAMAKPMLQFCVASLETESRRLV